MTYLNTVAHTMSCFNWHVLKGKCKSDKLNNFRQLFVKCHDEPFVDSILMAINITQTNPKTVFYRNGYFLFNIDTPTNVSNIMFYKIPNSKYMYYAYNLLCKQIGNWCTLDIQTNYHFNENLKIPIRFRKYFKNNIYLFQDYDIYPCFFDNVIFKNSFSNSAIENAIAKYKFNQFFNKTEFYCEIHYRLYCEKIKKIETTCLTLKKKLKKDKKYIKDILQTPNDISNIILEYCGNLL